MLDNVEDFLEIIKYYRKKQGLRQSDVALRLCIARSTYRSIENNRHHLYFEDFLRIVKILEIPFSAFWDKDEYYFFITKDELKVWKQFCRKINNYIALVEDREFLKEILDNKEL